MAESLRTLEKLSIAHKAPEEMPGREALAALLADPDPALWQGVFARARETAARYYGRGIFIRGLIEYSSFCQNDCLYCGLRRSNRLAQRYRLDEETVLRCCAEGYRLGFRTFVLQGGEDPFFTDERLIPLVKAIRSSYPDCAITLSLGERSRESYEKLFAAGANRYLLRHEAANAGLYAKLHPAEQQLASRLACLQDLKEIGYQVGAGVMVGAPFQTLLHLADDLLYLHRFQPQMVGIGPFIPHQDTPFAHEQPGSVDMTLRMLALTRLLLPKVLLPATTALGTLSADGRQQGVLAGANVVMPNLSPGEVRGKYALYDRKISDEAEKALAELGKKMEAIGYQIVTSRGDFPS